MAGPFSQQLLDSVPPSPKDFHRQPDLRSADPKERVVPAAAVLAPLVGLDDAQQVLARRKRAFMAAAAVALLSIIAAIAWISWLRTPAGVHYTILRRVLDAAGREPILDPAIGRTAEAVAATDGVEKMRRIALFAPEDVRPAVLAAGYLSLPKPDCSAAGRELRALAPMSSYGEKEAMAVRALLLAQARCGGTWIDAARTRSITTTALWPIQLGEAGLAAELRAIERSVAVWGWIEGEIALGIATRQPIVVSEEAVARWRATADFEFTPSFVRRLELGGKVDDPAAAYFARLAAESIRQNGYSTDGWGEWNLLAATFAAAGRRAEARTCMAEADRETVRWIHGWSWRALALRRLGDDAGARDAFARAETDAPPSDRPEVWVDYVRALAATGQWNRARLRAEGAPDERVRLLARCSLLELWAQRHPPA